MTTLDSFFRDVAEQFENAGIDTPKPDARILICHALGIDRAQMASSGDRKLTGDETAAIKALVGRRIRREPVARILGEREFWSLPFGMNEATLEPRPDSETLIEIALKDLRCRKPLSILDIGAGTGCLLLALLRELPEATGLGLDFDMRAVDQARANAERLDLSSRAIFRMSNWLDNLQDEKFDLVISNPPYIASGVIPTLDPEVRNYDPLAALDGGADGLTAYRTLIPQMKKRLNPEGFALFEVGQEQASSVAHLFAQNGFANVTTHMDLNGIERCVRAAV